jgi:hypothetical protein
MKFFLDENFPKIFEKYLVNLGHELIHIRSTNQQGLDVHLIFELAQDHDNLEPMLEGAKDTMDDIGRVSDDFENKELSCDANYHNKEKATDFTARPVEGL